VGVLLTFRKAIQKDPLNIEANSTTLDTSSYNRHTWTGVACNAKHGVVGIDLVDFQLNGTITHVIGNLAESLNYLSLTSNCFGGSEHPFSTHKLSKPLGFGSEGEPIVW
jgi:hypothetical protein